jgi:hypothetical protein
MRSFSFRRSELRQRLIKGTPLRAVSIHDGQLTGQRTYEIGQGFPKHRFSFPRSLIHQLSCQAACHWCYYQGWRRYANQQHTQHRQQWLHIRKMIFHEQKATLRVKADAVILWYLTFLINSEVVIVAPLWTPPRCY